MKSNIFFRFCLILLVSLSINSKIFGNDLVYRSLKEGIGIRAMSMGRAYTALAEGCSAGYYNPAGISRPGSMYKYENLDYQNDHYDSFYSHSLYASPMEFQFWKNQDTNKNSVEVTSYSFGKKGQKAIDWGISYKSVLEKYSGYKSTGWSTDLGILVHLTKNIDLGFCAHDVFKHNVKVPGTLAFGASLFTLTKDFIISTDLNAQRDGDDICFTSHIGAEAHIADGLIFRGGSFKNNLTAGVAIVLPIGELEYGMIYDMKDKQETGHMLGIRLGKGLIKPAAQRRYALFKPKSWAEFKISKNLVEGKSEISLLGGRKIGSNELLTLIHQANQDDSCKGFLVRIGNVSSSLSSIALIQEIRKELEKGKKKGKKIIAYLENWATLPEYYLASCADKIVMPELGTISHLGINLEIKKTKNFLNNWGIGSTIISSGIYKDSLMPTSKKLSEEKHVVLEELVNNLYHQVLYDIKLDRKIDWDKISKIFDGRIIPAKEAKEFGLVDEFGYWDKVKEIAKNKKKKKKADIVNIAAFSKVPEPQTIFSPFNKIAVIEIDGPINMGRNTNNFLFGGKSTGAEDINKLTESIKKDHSIKGVLIRINSPGGSLMASDKIYKAIEKLKKAKKVVYTSMGNIAASGGYFIAMNSDKVIANPGTLTGSIGVISAFSDFEELNNLLGIDVETIKTGKYMDMMSSDKKLTKETMKMLQDYQDNHHKYFIDLLKENRKLTDEEVKDLAQGQIFTGKQAVDNKIVDELGNFYDAVDALSKKIDISDPELVFYRMTKPFWIF